MRDQAVIMFERDEAGKQRQPKKAPFPKRTTLYYRAARLPLVRHLSRLAYKALLPRLPAHIALSMRHCKVFGYWPDLRRPTTFNEKLHWKKLNDRREILTRTADKFAVREYVSSKGLGDILIPLLWDGTEPGAIPFAQLPAGFVVKPSHGSGATIIVLDKRSVDVAAIARRARTWLATDYTASHEWSYTEIPSRILVEELLLAPGGGIPPDYKFFCFHGQPRLCQVDLNRFGDHRRNLYDMDWRLLPVRYQHENGPDVPKPPRLEQMLAICRTLSEGLGFARIDLYQTDERVCFGEITHYPCAGFGKFDPLEFDRELGAYWDISRT
jgi:hypothetical protein